MTAIFTNEDWRDKMQGASAEIDTRFGEPLTIVPCERKANFSPLYDVEHAVTLRGVFSYRAKQVVLDLDNRDKGTLALDSRDPIASFSKFVLPWDIRQGDLIERCDGSKFEITSIKPDGVARIVVDLVQMGVQQQ